MDNDILSWDPEFAPTEPSVQWDEGTQEASAPMKTADQVHDTLRQTVRALDGKPVDEVLSVLGRIKASTKVLAHLPKETLQTYEGVFEVLEHEATVLSDGHLNLEYTPIVCEYDKAVFHELRVIQSLAVQDRDPHALWSDLVEIVQRRHTRNQAVKLVEALDEKKPLEVLLEKFKNIEPPTTRKAVTRKGALRTARQVIQEHRHATAGRAPMRFSCGMPTLDRGYTGVDESLGLVSPGQFVVVMGPTGTGKTSFTNSVTPAFGVDLMNWGLDEAYQVVFHTEEESIDKLRGFRMDANQRFHHLADNVVIDAIGTSRKRMAETLYDLVIQADEWSRHTKRPIIEKLPYIVQVDYLQSIQEAGEDQTLATAITAEFLLRGVVAWNPDEMAKFSGVNFREYAGMAWPSGMEQHRVAVVAYAQLVKISDETLYYKAGKRGVQLSDFALLDDRDEPMWDVREGDLRLFGKNQMRGSGIISQNAHAILILHRSVPYSNPARKHPDGLHLVDTRARILFDKSRSGSQLSYAPMRFDVQSNGFRAQFFDELAERAIEVGKLTSFDQVNYTSVGDPILPQRPRHDPLDAFRY